MRDWAIASRMCGLVGRSEDPKDRSIRDWPEARSLDLARSMSAKTLRFRGAMRSANCMMVRVGLKAVVRWRIMPLRIS